MIEIRREDFSIDETIEKMKGPKIGAIAVYLGTVREFPAGLGLEFDNDNRAVHKLEEIRNRAIDRFDIEDVAITHRVGFLGVAESILLVAVSAAHRGPAFDACQSIIDDIKDLHKSWGREVSKQTS
jgi:molybdopterin synthase catalytic subunit